MLVEGFAKQIQQHRDKIAVKAGDLWLTYGELDGFASRIATVIEKQCPGPRKGESQSVGLLLPHGPYMMAAILGTLKAGKVYVPLSSDYPHNRLAYMLTDSEAVLVLTVSWNRDIVAQLGMEKEIPFIEIDRIDRDISPDNGKRQVKEDQLAYIMYTSGSTGKPKGVMQTHANATYYVRNWIQRFSLFEGDRMTLFSSFCHDGSVQDMFAALHCGATLYPYNLKNWEQNINLSRLLTREQITIWHSVPSLYTFFAGTLSGKETFPLLRFILLGGEPVREHEIKMQKKFFPGSILVNVYGQTESSVNSIQCISASPTTYKMLIGKPLDKTEIIVIDEEGRLVNPFEVGEIIVACKHLSPGYWKKKEITKNVFTDDEKLGRLYWTGDLGRLLPGGDIEFIGRKDSQVKIRGFRVEIGEIETKLLEHEHIKAAAVTVKTGKTGENRLCAYFVPQNLSGEPDQEKIFTVTALREYLSLELPDYMIPSYFVQLEQMPLTPNGKLDRNALPEPEEVRPHLEVTYTEAQTGIEKKITHIWKEVLNLDKIGIHDNLFDLGGNSFTIIRIINEIQRTFNRDIRVISMLRYPTIASFSKYLEGEVKGMIQPVAGFERIRRRFSRNIQDRASAQLAVIGMAGRFPGARNIDEFWENLKNSVESITFFSKEELKAGGVNPTLLDNPNYVKAKGILDDIECFDAPFFNYSPAEAEMMDPQLRLLHECCWEALEHAGYHADSYDGLIGLYAGNSPNHFWVGLTYLNRKNPLDTIFLNNNYTTKISYKLNLQGPSFIVQTACSTSLTAVHLACQGLLEHECDMALAGGVSVSLPKESGYFYQEEMIFSKDGHCRAFDSRGGGTIFGDGVGIAVLKRLGQALSDGDTIHALVKATAINNDGKRKVGITAPSVQGQAEVIHTAHYQAKIKPEDIDYIEAHGTGTLLGDPVEIEALKLGFNTDKTGYCAIGSVKTNIGHLNAAAGIAGFIKTVLALKHRLIPPSLHFENPNPNIQLENTPFYVNTQPIEWEKTGNSRLAGVSSFGIGGTNAHVVLEDAPGNKDLPEVNVTGTQNSAVRKGEDDGANQPYQLLLLSARNHSLLEQMRENLANHLEKSPGIQLNDVAYTLQTGRKAFQYRSMAVCRDVKDAFDILSFPDSRKIRSANAGTKERNVVFMFPGQGSQYTNMGLGLYQTRQVFRHKLDRCFKVLKRIIDYDIKKILYPPEMSSKADEFSKSPVSHLPPDIDQIEFTQPLLFSFEYAMAKMLMHLGLKPVAMIGHSIGEYVAAHLAGIFSLIGALKLVVLRGQLMQKMSPGFMLSVTMAEKEVNALLEEKAGKSYQLSIAAVNTPDSCVICGPLEAKDPLIRWIEEKGCKYRLLHTSHPGHSVMIEPFLPQYEQAVKEVKLNPPKIPIISGLTGKWLKDEEAVDPGYWVKHLRRTVRFSDGLQQLLKKKDTVFVETGPGRALSTLVQQHGDGKQIPISINLVRHPKEKIPDTYYLADKLGQLWLKGIKIDWQFFYPDEKRKRLPLPTYPFEKQYFWFDGDSAKIKANLFINNTLTGKRPDIAQWFYISNWQPGKFLQLPQPEVDKARLKSNWLLFINANESKLGLELKEKLEESGDRVTIVKAGESFSQSGENEYTICPAKEEDYDTLMGQCRHRDKIPHRIMHLWSLGQEQENLEQIQDHGFYSLLFLARSIERLHLDEGHRVKIATITNQAQGVTGSDLLYPQKAVIIGAALVMQREYPYIDCRCIDILTPGSGLSGEEQLIEHLLAELKTDTTGPEPVVAYRGQQRFVKTFLPKQLSKPVKENPRLKKEGVYLITGGLGGIGLVLAEHLAKAVQARLVLIGRRGLPPKETWDEIMHSGSIDTDTREKMEKIRAMEKNGARILVFAADVTDSQRMKKIISQTEQLWGKLDGVIHTAGAADGALIQARNQELSQRVLAPKVTGTLVLDALLGDRQLDFFILCSSIAAVTARAGQAAYCAANTFLDHYAHYRHQQGKSFFVSINWDAWQQVGMAVNELNREIARPGSDFGSQQSEVLAREGILPDEGVDIFLRILGGEPAPQVLVSTIDLFFRLNRIQFPSRKLTSSTSPGKHSRPELASAYAPPNTDAEKALERIFQDFLKIEKLGIHDNFFELGGDSLKAISIIGRINKKFNVKITIDEIYKSPTIAQLAPAITRMKKNTFADIEKVEEKEFYPLSYHQNRMWILNQLEPGTSAFNMPYAIMLRHEVDEDLIKKTLTRLVQRHESLRTGFNVVKGEPVQFISGKIEVPFEKIDIFSLEKEEKKVRRDEIYDELVFKPFDLSRPPLFRTFLLKHDNKLYELMFNLHHIIADGWSIQVLKKDFILIYEAYRQGKEPRLEPLAFQYCDFTLWHHGQLENPDIKKQSHRFWKTKLESGIPGLQLPEDFKGHENGRQGAAYEIRLDAELSVKIKKLAKTGNTTVFTVMFTAFVLFLYRFSQQSEIALSIIGAGRDHISLKKIMGHFVNSILFKTRIHTEESFSAFFKRVNHDILETFLHQAYPLELVCKDLGIRHPDIPVTFNMLNLQEENELLPLDSLKSRHTPKVYDVRFDLEPYITVHKNGITIRCVYKKQRFAPDTIEYMMAEYHRILDFFSEYSHKSYNAYIAGEHGHTFQKRKKRN